MTWEVEYTDPFGEWWRQLNEEEQDSVASAVRVLQMKGPNLPHPYSSGIKKSRHNHMRELRIQHRGTPYRVLYAFDPRRVAILLLGGTKKGNALWYDKMVPLADRLYDEHLRDLETEDSPNG